MSCKIIRDKEKESFDIHYQNVKNIYNTIKSDSFFPYRYKIPSYNDKADSAKKGNEIEYSFFEKFVNNVLKNDNNWILIHDLESKRNNVFAKAYKKKIADYIVIHQKYGVLIIDAKPMFSKEYVERVENQCKDTVDLIIKTNDECKSLRYYFVMFTKESSNDDIHSDNILKMHEENIISLEAFNNWIAINIIENIQDEVILDKLKIFLIALCIFKVDFDEDFNE